MKKLNNKKGFTIVELVIVIAVIGILAGVLIPTFSSVIDSAKESSALQEAKATLENILAINNGSIASETKFVVCDVAKDNSKATVQYTYSYENSKLNLVDNAKEFTDTDTIYVNTELVKFAANSKTKLESFEVNGAGEILVKAVFGVDETGSVSWVPDKNQIKVKKTSASTDLIINVAYTPDVSKSTVVVIPKPKTNASESNP